MILRRLQLVSFSIIALGFFSSVALAEPEKEAWYVSADGRNLVRDSVYGNLHAEINFSKSGKISVYFRMFSEDCKTAGTDVFAHDPIYINGILTKFSHYCDGSFHYFMPATDAGRDNLINEFKFKKSVELKTLDGDAEYLFSAKGFSEAFTKVSLGAGAI